MAKNIFNNISLNKASVKIEHFINYGSENPSTYDPLPAHEKYDYQIKCQPGCCIFNTHSCLLIPPLYQPDLSPPRPCPKSETETNQHSDYIRIYLLHTSIPITSTIFLLLLLLVWAPLFAHRYQSAPLTIPKWGETYLPWGLSECLPEITLIP